jgi:hypothetical protein
MGTSLVRVVMLMIKKEEDERGRKCGKVFRTGLPGGPSAFLRTCLVTGSLSETTRTCGLTKGRFQPNKSKPVAILPAIRCLSRIYALLMRNNRPETTLQLASRIVIQHQYESAVTKLTALGRNGVGHASAAAELTQPAT